MVLLIGFMLVPLTAVGEDNAQIVTFSTTTERVKLRERPDDNARVMGQYYGGQPLELLEQGKKWDYVSIGGRTGYMMRKYLTDLTEEAAAPVAEVYPEGESLSLYDQAGGNGRVIGTVEGEFELLGIVSQDWLHVRQVQADGAVVVGFVSALGTTWAGDGGEMQVATRDNTKLALYAEPSKQSENLGEFFNGVVFQTLIETESVNGWVHVSLDGYTGYMQTSSLTAEVADVPLLSRPRVRTPDVFIRGSHPGVNKEVRRLEAWNSSRNCYASRIYKFPSAREKSPCGPWIASASKFPGTRWWALWVKAAAARA